MGELLDTSGQYIELFLIIPEGFGEATISPVFKLKDAGCCSSTTLGSSSERNSRFERAVLNISSVIDDPLVFKGEF